MMRMYAFCRDLNGGFASAALPLFFATFGMTLLGVGAVLSIMPLAFAGIGLAVVAFAAYLVAMGMDHQDRRRQGKRAARAAAARQAAAEDAAARHPPQDPRRAHAVAALSGEGAPGIWPPLPSQQGAGMAPRAAGATTPTPKPAAAKGPVGMWGPGERVAPAGWDDDDEASLVEFASVPQQATHASGGVTFVEGTIDPAAEDLPEPRPRVAAARADPSDDARDFRIWPGAKDVDSWSTFTGERRPQASRYSEEDLKRSMDARRAEIAGRLPTVGAILQDVSLKETELQRLQREATRGKCSQCAAVIWAPKKRPIVLKCPGCGHKAKLY